MMFYTSNLSQLLDVLLFGWLKSATKYLPRNDSDPAQIDHLAQIFKTCETVRTSTMVRASWLKVGFEDCKRDDAFHLVVVDKKIRDSP
jgi:hypothetical protein